MQVRAIVSFTSLATGELDVWPVGRVGLLPAEADWLKLGWVVPVEDEPVSASRRPATQKKSQKKADD